MDAEIENVKRQIKCLHNFICLEKPCKAKDLPVPNYVECLEKSHRYCSSRMECGPTISFCKCPLRVYMIKHNKEPK